MYNLYAFVRGGFIMYLKSIPVCFLFAILFASPSFSQDIRDALEADEEVVSIQDPSDPMTAEYIEALSMLYSWGIVREDFVKHADEPVNRYELVYTLSEYTRHFFPKSHDKATAKYDPNDIESTMYPDVSRGHWATEAINIVSFDIFHMRYAEGDFNGERISSRYEAALVTAKFFFAFHEGLSNTALNMSSVSVKTGDRTLSQEKFDQYNPLFLDVYNDYWAYDAVSELAKSGVLADEYSDSFFHGNDALTREALALWLYTMAEVLQLEDFEETEPLLFLDTIENTCGG
jgi:hypothetical protein